MKWFRRRDAENNPAAMTRREMRVRGEAARFSREEAVCDALVESALFETVDRAVSEASETEFARFSRAELFLLRTRYADRPNLALFVVYRDRESELFAAYQFPTAAEARTYFEARKAFLSEGQ